MTDASQPERAVAKKRSVLLACLVALAGVTAAILVLMDHGPRAAAERACKDELATVRVSIQPADQVEYPGQRSLRIELRDGSGGGIQGIPPGDNGSAEQLFIDGCIAERLTPD
jgi:hypothetical protein